MGQREVDDTGGEGWFSFHHHVVGREVAVDDQLLLGSKPVELVRQNEGELQGAGELSSVDICAVDVVRDQDLNCSLGIQRPGPLCRGAKRLGNLVIASHELTDALQERRAGPLDRAAGDEAHQLPDIPFAQHHALAAEGGQGPRGGKPGGS